MLPATENGRLVLDRTLFSSTATKTMNNLVLSSISVRVIGAGIIGLSAGIRLLEAGCRVELVSRDFHPNITSSVAAAFWYPYKVDPEWLVGPLAKQTYEEFVHEAEEGTPGVTLRRVFELFHQPVADPWWRDLLPTFRHAASADLPPGYADGFSIVVPVIEMPTYLPHLMRQFQRLGGRLRHHTFSSIDEAHESCDVVINCAGLGARELVPDGAMLPARGQVVRVAQVGIDRILIDEHNPDGITYIVPRSNDCILGGTFESGQEQCTPDPETTERIRERCHRLEPKLHDAATLSAHVGTRPCRQSLRLEIARQSGVKTVVHNYGHGGGGVTLSWGCAREVVNLLCASHRTRR
jgi:D-amino-acid oxidase